MLVDDGYLIERLRTGDNLAFEELVEHHAAPLLAVTRRILRDEEEARDAVQETFVAAFRGIGGVPSESSGLTWLHRLSVHNALMKLRVRARREKDVDALLPIFEADGHQQQSSVSWTETAEEILQREQARALVRQCIDQLPETYRIVLVLRDIEQLPADVVAEKLQIRSEEHTSELQSLTNLVCRLLLEKKKKYKKTRSSRLIDS